MSNSEEVHHCKGENYRNSKYKPETLSNNSADGDTTVPMSNSNLSSPITQWQEKVQKALLQTVKLSNDESWRYDHDDKDTARYFEYDITSATIELIEGLIGEDEPELTKDGLKPPGPMVRNDYRHQLRQSLKEMNHDIER